MRQAILRSSAIILVLFLAACSSGPQSKPQAQAQEYPQPVFTADRLLPEDFRGADEVSDPWEGMNKRIYNFNYHFDQAVFLPVVRGYKAVIPSFARTGVNNFFNNVEDFRTFVNSILQFSPKKVGQSAGRVVVNTTIGILGLFDVATKMDIGRPVEEFGQTLGHWGVGQGPYLVVPFLGPSNLRDGVALVPDLYVQTQARDAIVPDPWRIPVGVLSAVDVRANVSFRYYETGNAFEYRMVRWLYSTKRKLDVAK